MIRQHFLQQQRLNYNHDRLLERYQTVVSPQVSEFRPFGTSKLPGRNYEQYLNTRHGDNSSRDSLVALSRATIGRSSETYRWMGRETSETLPDDVNSFVKYSPKESASLVHAERFEPVQVYDHPVFGPTPAYIRPVFSSTHFDTQANRNDSDSDSDIAEYTEIRSQTSGHIPSKIDHNSDKSTASATIHDHKHASDDDADDADDDKFIDAPKGYISYKKWKAKYADLIPVNPLLFNIYTQRPYGSINSYGQSVYTSLNHMKYLKQTKNAGDQLALSDIGSISPSVPRNISSTTNITYQKPQQSTFAPTIKVQPLGPLRSGNINDSSDDEATPPSSPVVLPRTTSTTLTPTETEKIPSSTPIKSPSIPTIGVTSSSTSQIPSTNTNTELNSKTNDNMSGTPIALSSSTYNTPPKVPPPPPPLPAFLSTTASSHTYQTPSTLPFASNSAIQSTPKAFSVAGSTGTYQAPSVTSFPVPSGSSFALNPAQVTSPNKAVTFGGAAAFPTAVNDVSSSSDSDDEKQKRRRQKKKLREAGIMADADSSSDD